MTRDDIQRHLLTARQVAAIATAFTLPFSTSGEAIAVSVFSVLAVLTMDYTRLAAVLRKPQAYLPLALFALILIGVLWSMLPLGSAIKWVGPYAKLLLIPLVMATAFTPKQALQIGYGFLAGCVLMLALSYLYFLWPTGPWSWFKSPGVPFKDNAVQSECFGLCAFGLSLAASRLWNQVERWRVIAIAVLAALFFADIFMLYISKTGALTAAALLGLLLLLIGGWRRGLLIAVAVLAIAALALTVSKPAQQRLAEIVVDMKAGNSGSTSMETVSTASRLDFWRKAVEFVRAAPLLGHGTGSIRPLYQTLEATRPSPYGEAVADPHNQVLHTVLQVGLVGGLLLLAMWAAHGWMFFGRNIASALGLAVVLQHVIGSMFNSHLSQVTQGMLYCTAVGLLGSLLLRARRAPPAA